MVTSGSCCLNGILMKFSRYADVFLHIWFLGTGHSDVLAADRLYDDHLHCRYPEYLRDELIEAAEIDGATPRQAPWKSDTIPMVMPSITVCAFLTLTNSFKLFDQNLALTDGEPNQDD